MIKLLPTVKLSKGTETEKVNMKDTASENEHIKIENEDETENK